MKTRQFLVAKLDEHMSSLADVWAATRSRAIESSRLPVLAIPGEGCRGPLLVIRGVDLPLVARMAGELEGAVEDAVA